jgi:hypothetical protein
MEKVYRNLGFLGYPNYEVSNKGDVVSLNYKKTGQRHPLTLNLSKKGYVYVWLGKWEYVHRLVASAFIENPNNLPCVNHKDENKSNNFIYVNDDGSVDYEKSNLEWCTYKYNRNYGNASKKLSEINTNGVTSKPVLQYSRHGEFIKEYPSIIEVQRTLGINAGSICACCKGIKNKIHAGGFIWRYKNDFFPVVPQKGIIQMTKDGNFLNWFSGISEASHATGISYGALQKCIMGYSKTSGGFLWKKE